MKYLLAGRYYNNGVLGELEGQLELDGELITGKVIDKSSPVPERRIQGRLKERDGKVELSFRVNVPSADLVDILYSLDKEGSVVGDYTGVWMPVNKVNGFRVTGPPREMLRDTIYPVEMDVTEPKPEDSKKQAARISLTAA